MKFIERDLTSPRCRRRDAGCLDRLIRDAHAEPRRIRQLNPTVEQAVALACVGPFQEIREILVDVERTQISEDAVRRLETFLSDGLQSALYHHDAGAARRAAAEPAASFRWSAAQAPVTGA